MKTIKMVFFVVACITAFAALIMLLWNALIPTLFNGPEISIFQSFGILILSRLLFGGWGRKFHSHPKHYYWKRRMELKMASMSEEEKEKFKEDFACSGWNSKTNCC